MLPVAVALLVVLLMQRRDWEQASDAAAQRSEPTPGPGLEPGRLLPRWIALLLAVSVEFCLVFWAADAFTEWHGACRAAAPVLAAMFLLGMAVVRAASAKLTAGRHPLVVILAACGVALIGFAAFWAWPNTIGAAVGLLIAGGGVALLYPASLARLVAAWPQDRGPRRGPGRSRVRRRDRRSPVPAGRVGRCLRSAYRLPDRPRLAGRAGAAHRCHHENHYTATRLIQDRGW